MPEVGQLIRLIRLIRSLPRARAVRFFQNLNKIYNINILEKDLLTFYRAYGLCTQSLTKYEINEFNELTSTTPRLDRRLA